ncbi:type III pantothenate kinase [Flavobacteriaceae bacterium MAR_2010_188]|nr:type III pantothenate kinase [Flavobacteriaceae bacterium MAR_2010_188]
MWNTFYMTVAIDIGNSLVKIGIFDKGKIHETKKFNMSKFEDAISLILNDFPQIRLGIISSVGNLDDDSLASLKSKINLLILNSSTKLPFKNNYKTPNTLGVDRVALVAAAVNKFPDRNVLIIDAGTCITYDFVDRDSIYHGGAISPGVRLRYQSLHNYTAKLPLLENEVPVNIIGGNTEESIHSGVVLGVVMEIDAAIDNYTKQFSDLTVILTGGDCNFLSNQLKNSIFANSNFLLEGLNHILEYNTH